MKHVTQTPWTDEERAMLRRLRANGLGATRIGLMMGRSKNSVDKQLRYLALNAPQAPRQAKPLPGPPGRPPAPKVTLLPLPSLADGQAPPHR
jgi:hypothetical protein